MNGSKEIIFVLIEYSMKRVILTVQFLHLIKNIEQDTITHKNTTFVSLLKIRQKMQFGYHIFVNMYF
jgi:hypothetical protein